MNSLAIADLDFCQSVKGEVQGAGVRGAKIKSKLRGKASKFPYSAESQIEAKWTAGYNKNGYFAAAGAAGAVAVAGGGKAITGTDTDVKVGA